VRAAGFPAVPMMAGKGARVDGHGYDLVIVGAGSGNMLPAKEFGGWRIAVAESGRFGGTCLNRGCIPSKMLVRVADIAQEVRHAGRFGVRAKWAGADWPAIRQRVFGRIDPLHERAVAHRRAQGADVFLGEARFTAPGVLQVGEEEVRGERFVLATGSRPAVPAIDGLAQVPYLTSDTVMRLDRAAPVDGRAGRRVHRRGDEPHLRLAGHRGHHRRPR
jgi:mycothione reductase